MSNKAVLHDLYAAFDAGDIPLTLKGIDESVVLVSPSHPDIPWSGTYQGHEGALKFFAALGGSTEFERYERNEFTAEGDVVLVRGRTAGMVKATGRRFDTEWVHSFTFEDGRATRFQEFYDTADVATAFG